jgi:hypothetical protein
MARIHVVLQFRECHTLLWGGVPTNLALTVISLPGLCSHLQRSHMAKDVVHHSRERHALPLQGVFPVLPPSIHLGLAHWTSMTPCSACFSVS